ncbi:hypothetical protein WJX82_008538 [Trebouxia sp. C0006]
MLQTEVQLNSLKQKLSFHRCLLTTIRLEFLTTRVNPAYTEADQTFASLGLPREYLRQREMDNLELTLINQEIVERINFWRLHVLNLEDFADDAGIPISQDLRAVCRLCDGDLEPIQGADAILEVLHDAYKAQTSIKYFAAARVPWDGLGGVPFGPVQVSHGDMDGWTLGSIISYDAQAVPTPLPDSEPEVEVKSPQCVEELISEEASQLLEAYERLNKAAKAQKAKIAPLTAASTLHVPHLGGKERRAGPAGTLKRSTGQKKKKAPQFLECERVITWGHDKYQEIENAEPGTAKAEFPLAESSTSEYPEPEIEVEAPQCVEESVSKTPLAVTEAGAAYESPGDEAALATELCKANPAAPGQAAIRYTPAAPEALKASPQAPPPLPHKPSLDDLRVKEGQMPLTNIDSACRKLLKGLGLKASPSLKAKQQEAKEVLKVYEGLAKAAKAEKAAASPTATPPHHPKYTYVVFIRGLQGQREQPRGQSEDGRPSRQTERSTGQKKAQVKNKKAPSRQHEGAFGGGQVLGGVSRRLGKTECERVAIWGHDKYLAMVSQDADTSANAVQMAAGNHQWT